jgi:hypothetical protein
MDLLSNLDATKWTNEQPDKIPGLVEYIVIKSKMVQPGKFEFALKENTEDGALLRGVLENAQGKYNPLNAVHNVEMKVKADNGLILAINLDGDCVIRK